MTRSNGLNWAPIPAGQLNFWATFRSGQTFRWRERHDGEWRGVIADTAVRIRACEDGFWWQTYPEPDRWGHVRDYFALDVEIAKLYEEWTRSEERIAPAVESFRGLRILRQEPEEAFFS